MSAADKARFHLERSVPDLQELSRKGIFSNEEIVAIVKKRNDFEHILNAPGPKSADYIRYAAYEMNVEALRRKRVARLGIKSTAYSGQRSVLGIFDRATKKFPGDRALWMQYIQYCQKERANKRLAKVFTSVLRLRPRDWSLWIVAAKYYAETQGDMATARGYLQRGLRFCKDSKKLYLEFAKLEMVYLAKLSARRRILGLDEEKAASNDNADEDENMIRLPELTMEDVVPQDSTGLEHFDEKALKRIADAPMLRGALSIAIFDAAMKQFNDAELAEEFFELTLDMEQTKGTTQVRQHVLEWLRANAQDSAEMVLCEAREPMCGMDVLSADFPAAFGEMLSVIKQGRIGVSSTQSSRLDEKLLFLLLVFLRNDRLDEALRQVMFITMQRSLKALSGRNPAIRVDTLAAQLEKNDRTEDATTLKTLCMS